MLIKVFNGGELIAPAAMGGVSAAPKGVRVDSLAYPQELTQLVTKSRAEYYRPLKWRRYLKTEPVATWAQRIEDRKHNSKMEDPVNLSGKAPTQELPMPSFETSNQFLPVFSFGLAFGYTDEDVDAARHLGSDLRADNVIACNLAFEQFLERVASVGHTANGVTLKGLGNLADVGTATAVTKAATGTTWAVATAAEIVEDLTRIVNAGETASLENNEIDTILLPVAQFQRAASTFTAANETTALDLFKRMFPRVSIQKWNKLSDQGAGGTPCAIGLDSTDPFGPRMLMKWEAQYGTPLRGLNGWLVPGKIATGGVRCLNPSAVIKMSGL